MAMTTAPTTSALAVGDGVRVSATRVETWDEGRFRPEPDAHSLAGTVLALEPHRDGLLLTVGTASGDTRRGLIALDAVVSWIHATTEVDLSAGRVAVDTRIAPLVRTVDEAGLHVVSSCEGDLFAGATRDGHLTFEVWEAAAEFVAICFERGADVERLQGCSLAPTCDPEIGVLRGVFHAPTVLLAHLQHLWVPDLENPFADVGLDPAGI